MVFINPDLQLEKLEAQNAKPHTFDQSTQDLLQQIFIVPSLCAMHWRQNNGELATFFSPQEVNNTDKHKSLYFLFPRLYTFDNLYG